MPPPRSAATPCCPASFPPSTSRAGETGSRGPTCRRASASRMRSTRAARPCSAPRSRATAASSPPTTEGGTTRWARRSSSTTGATPTATASSSSMRPNRNVRNSGRRPRPRRGGGLGTHRPDTTEQGPRDRGRLERELAEPRGLRAYTWRKRRLTATQPVRILWYSWIGVTNEDYHIGTPGTANGSRRTPYVVTTGWRNASGGLSSAPAT